MHKKYRNNLKNRPVKVCTSCSKPIINPDYYKSNVHTTGIKGVLSECQKIRNSYYKKHVYTYVRFPDIRKPKGIFTKYDVKKERVCLKCNKFFPSQSLHNRVCERCKKQQPDIMNFSSIALETHHISELFNYLGDNYDM